MIVKNCLTQTDPRWGAVDMINQILIRDSGCLLTSIVNILRDYSDELKAYTPLQLDSFLDKKNGYTRGGLIIWDVLEKFFKFKHQAYITPHAKPVFSNDKKKYWVVQIPYKATGHFCNVIADVGDEIIYFDVYDGKTKNINIKDTISIREFTFGV